MNQATTTMPGTPSIHAKTYFIISLPLYPISTPETNPKRQEPSTRYTLKALLTQLICGKNY